MNEAKECLVCKRFGSSFCGLHMKIKHKVEAVNILAGIRENKAALDGCKQHNFGLLRITKGMPLANRHYQCVNCGGSLTLSNIITYQKGFKAAGGCVNQVSEIKYRS